MALDPLLKLKGKMELPLLSFPFSVITAKITKDAPGKY